MRNRCVTSRTLEPQQFQKGYAVTHSYNSENLKKVFFYTRLFIEKFEFKDFKRSAPVYYYCHAGCSGYTTISTLCVFCNLFLLKFVYLFQLFYNYVNIMKKCKTISKLDFSYMFVIILQKY